MNPMLYRFIDVNNWIKLIIENDQFAEKLQYASLKDNEWSSIEDYFGVDHIYPYRLLAELRTK